MSDYIAALRRHKLIVGVGVLLALLAALASVFRLPSFERRDAPTYTATSRLLVTGADAPYIRTAIMSSVEREDSGGTTGRGAVTRGGSVIVQNAPPDVTTYVRSANLFPILVESDQVKAEREARFGPTVGIVRSSAIYQVSTPSRITLSEVPVIQVFGTSRSPGEAIKLTQETTVAFVGWIRKQQQAARIPERQRITLQTIQQPRNAVASTTASPAVSFVVFTGVLFAFCLLAVVVDRLRGGGAPRSATIPLPVAPVASPVSSAPGGSPEPVVAEEDEAVASAGVPTRRRRTLGSG